MADDRPAIETGVDRLLHYVRGQDDVDLAEAAEALGADTETVLDWASALDDAGLIEIHHSVRRGRVLVASGKATPDKMEEAREAAEEAVEREGVECDE